MNIQINSLSLTNFKCFRSKEITFNEDIVTIKGRNGVGKTTIFDAILFCLFGKNSQDQTKFNIKTNDENGDIIPHLDHAVEVELSLCGETISTVSLRHAVKEKWTKKRGSTEEVFSGDTHEYFVNGELYTAADYKKYIASLIDEQTFRILTNPQYFPSLKWQEQREFLTKMVGDIEPLDDGVGFVELNAYLRDNNQDLIAFRKHLSYQIKQIKDKLEKIPVRLEEQNKALPENLDWDAIEKQKQEIEKQISEIDSKINQLQQGNGADIKREEIRNQISSTTAAVDKLYYEATSQYNSAKAEKDKNVSEYSLKFNNALNDQKLMEQTILADERLIERCKEVDYEAELQKLRDQWPSNKFVVDPDAAICPTCGQPIPDEQYQEKVEEMRKNFNLQREAKIKSLNEQASKIKQQQSDAAEELKKLEQKLADDKTQLQTIKKNINTIFSEKAKIEKQQLVSVEAILSNSEAYTQLSSQLADLKKALTEIADVVGVDDMLLDLKSKRTVLYNNFCDLQQKLATRQQYDKITSLINGINEEQKELVKQLSELEKKEDVARNYEDRKNAILEQRINEHFSITRWKMFRTVVNGGDSYNEPFCECYDLNGTAYHDGLNQAARLNIGLDIINSMCRIYNVSAPIIIDQSESTLNILETTGQQVRLEVSDCDLQIV